MIICFAILALLLNAKTSSAQVLLEENFDYPVGAKLTDNGWAAISGAGTLPIMVYDTNLLYTNYPSITGKAVKLTSGTAEDDKKTFTEVTSGNVYAAFLINLYDSKLTQDYAFSFSTNGASTSYFGRVNISRDTTDLTKFRIGISKTAAAAFPTATVTKTIVWSPFIYSTKQTHLLVVKYKIIPGNTNDSVFLFINPSVSTTEPTPSLVANDASNNDFNPGSIFLRQGTYTPSFSLYDGIRVDTTWAGVMGFTSSILTPPSLTAATTPTVDNTFDVTFTENAAWRDSIYEIAYDGNILPTAAYNKTASGKITFDPAQSAFLQTAKTANIVIKANGYSNATVSQTIGVGAVTASNSTLTVTPALALNTTSTFTATAKDKYNNLVNGYIFKYDFTVTNIVATNTEQYSVDGIIRTASISDVDLTATNASGVVSFDLIIPSTVDGDDGIGISLRLNDGVTLVGTEYSYIAPTSPTMNISGVLTEATLSTDTLFINLSNTNFVDNNILTNSITLNNAPLGLTIDSLYFVDNTHAK